MIKGETPAKKNSRIVLKNGKNISSVKYQQWHLSAVAQLFLQQRPKTPINKPVSITMDFIHGDLRRRDSDNATSSILDLLTDCRILSDDNWQIVHQLVINNSYSKNNACCKVQIDLFNGA